MRTGVFAGAILLASCKTAAPPAELPLVNVVGRNFALEAPDSLPAGPTRFHFRNDGTVAHEVAIGRVKKGVSLDSLLRLELAGKDIEGLYDPGEGLLFANNGETIDSELVVTLEKGRDYVLICTLDEKGKAHSMLGMVRGLRVKAF